MADHFTLHIRGVGHWTNKLYQLFEEEYEQQSALSRAGTTPSVVTNIKKSIKRNYQSWSGSLKEKRNDDVVDFTEYIKDHEKRALEQRKLDRMEKRQTKLNLINDGLEEHQTKRHLSASSRQHHNMRNARSVKYRPDEMSKQAGENIHPDGTADAGTNNKKLVLREPLEIFVDGPFGSPSSNITRAEHAVLIGTGIGRNISV